MPVVEVNNFDLAFLTERVDFSSRHDSAVPNLVDAKVQMASAVDPHEDDVVLGILLALGVLSLAVRQLVLTRLSVKHIVEVVVEFGAWGIEVNEDPQFLLVI